MQLVARKSEIVIETYRVRERERRQLLETSMEDEEKVRGDENSIVVCRCVSSSSMLLPFCVPHSSSLLLLCSKFYSFFEVRLFLDIYWSHWRMSANRGRKRNGEKRAKESKIDGKRSFSV